MRHACLSPARRLTMARRATAPMEASASPRKPSVAARSRSSSVEILLVANRATASGRSSRSMPAPSSTTRRRRTPPSARSTAMDWAPASRLFSSNSFSAAAGRSTTSPAAIWFTRSSGSARMRPTRGMLHWLTCSPAGRGPRARSGMTPKLPLAAPANPEAADQALQAEQLRLLFRFSVVGHLATLLVIFTLGAILWEDLARPALFMWFVATSLTAIGRYLLYKAFIRQTPPSHELRLWGGRFIAGTILAGVCWAMIGSLLLPDATRMVQRLSVVMLVMLL